MFDSEMFTYLSLFSVSIIKIENGDLAKSDLTDFLQLVNLLFAGAFLVYVSLLDVLLSLIHLMLRDDSNCFEEKVLIMSEWEKERFFLSSESVWSHFLWSGKMRTHNQRNCSVYHI